MNLLNLGILAHVDAGKTTTVEQMLYQFGGLRTLGSVDKGNTQTDFLSVERARGISVASASVSVLIASLSVPVKVSFSFSICARTSAASLSETLSPKSVRVFSL